MISTLEITRNCCEDYHFTREIVETKDNMADNREESEIRDFILLATGSDFLARGQMIVK
ncbi:MAG: hypothetical protein V3W18_14755 [candidate division Zixibacteria bacterium]